MDRCKAIGNCALAVAALLICLVVGGCDKRADSAKGPTTGRAGAKRIASLVPAATDMLLAMGAGDQLVAVSNFETSARVKDLPRVGDYQSTDWETLGRLRPDVMIIQIAADRLPAGLKERAATIGVELVNVKIYTLEDALEAMRVVGRAAGTPEKGESLGTQVRGKLERLRVACAKRPAVRALVFRNGTGQDVVGPGNFLDDLLKIVNVTNAAAEMGNPWPSIDREKIAALAPDAIVVLLPDGSEGSLEQSKRFWRGLETVPAVRDGRVCTITDPYALLPGSRLAEVAERIAKCVHGEDVLNQN
jgi:ABC-type Fe3+-hydroxamate transport system substrate-binding protein